MKNQTTFFGARATRALLPVAAACLVAVLTGCASPSYTISPEAQANAAAERPAAPSDADFPALNSAKWVQGSFPSIEALRAMRTGMGKDQVRELLSWPHFSEGLGGVREWNYIFHFRTGAGPEYITCQYMVRFNKDVLSNGMYWKGPNCADLLKQQVPMPAAAVVQAPAPMPAMPRKVTLAADGLFRFDGSARADLLPEGARKIQALASDIQRGFKSTSYIVVTGHTDRLGTDAYNDRLSMARAQTVRELLVQHGIDGKQVRTAGEGKRRPVIDCPGVQTPALVACLQPNRRVEIEVVGEQ